jgi:hypothetical protein
MIDKSRARPSIPASSRRGLRLLDFLTLIAAAALTSCGPRVEVPHNEQDSHLLDVVLKPAGIAQDGLRDIGIGADLDYLGNKRAAAWYEGRLAALSLRDAGLESLPDLSRWTALETLVLADNRLTELPDLSGATALRHLDLSGNRIASLDPTHLPPKLETLNLSGNPLADLGPLAKISTLTELRARNTAVADISPLLDLKLSLVDLRGCKIASLPDRLPKDSDFVVDLVGCPVVSKVGVLDTWSFNFSQGGAPGGIQTTTGVITDGTFEAHGTWKVVPKISSVSIPALTTGSTGAVNVEISVTSGMLRLYLPSGNDPRGRWFDSGNVKGHGGAIRKLVMTYADATPGHPVRLFGHLDRMGEGPFSFIVETQGTVPVTNLAYRVWR